MYATYETQYRNLLADILANGERASDRTGTGTLSVLHRTIRVDLQEEFPILTSKKVRYDLAIGEMLWILNGETTITALRHRSNLAHDQRTIWCADLEKYIERSRERYEDVLHEDDWYREDDLGRVYGSQLREFSGEFGLTDQLKFIVEKIKTRDVHWKRRLLLCYWNPDITLDDDETLAALPPCHYAFQFTTHGNLLNGVLSIRSNDIFLGQPFNAVGYATLLHIVANLTGYSVGELIIQIADAHIYLDHIDAAKELLSRDPLPNVAELIIPDISTLDDLKDLTAKDFKVYKHQSHGFIKANQSC